MFDASVLADRSFITRARDAALDIGNVLKDDSNISFCSSTMRTPVSAIHLGLFCRHTLREGIEAAAALAQAEINYRAQTRPQSARRSQSCARSDDFACACCSRFSRASLSFDIESFYTTTFRAEGSTSRLRQRKVSTSPSTMTSTGRPAGKSTRLACRRSASG